MDAIEKKQILKGCNPHNMSLNLRYQDHLQLVLWHSFLSEESKYIKSLHALFGHWFYPRQVSFQLRFKNVECFTNYFVR